MKRAAILILTCIVPLAVFRMECAADVISRPTELHPLFKDHVVLQRDAKVPVWGWAEPGTRITVGFADQMKSAVADKDGKWMAALDPMITSAEGRELRVYSQQTLVSRVTDVLVGDVWICSGQSNMEMGIGLCNESEEIAKADFPNIRLLTVPHRISYTPESNLTCEWLPSSPQNVMKGTWGGFSAAAYFFGKNLHRELGVPIGIIHSSWGGTVCEAWTSREALSPLASYQSGLARVEQVANSPAADKLNAVMDQWYKDKDPGTSKEWFKPETDVSAWRPATMPGGWASCGLPKYEGIVWARHDFEIPASWAGKELVLNLGPVADVDTTWINGVVVGRSDYFDQNRTYKLPSKLLKPGGNVIVMRVMNAGSGGLMGTPDQMKIHPLGTEESAVSLAGAWRVQETATRTETGEPLAGNPNVPSVLYNGMIAPLIPYAIKGTIWYQGESNAGQAYQYRSLLPAMIRDWRSRFRVGDFGFHIVSLAAHKPASTTPQDSDWAELREAQAMTAKALPNCGLALAIDIGDANDIHPKNKREVGHRLALSALAVTYGKKLDGSGPWYRSMEITPGGIRIAFDHVGSGLVAKGGKLTGFAIAGEDRKFVRADATIEGNTVLVSSPGVPGPVAVRYAWDANPACNLYNQDELPAVPFRTDDWPGVTAK